MPPSCQIGLKIYEQPWHTFNGYILKLHTWEVKKPSHVVPHFFPPIPHSPPGLLLVSKLLSSIWPIFECQKASMRKAGKGM